MILQDLQNWQLGSELFRGEFTKGEVLQEAGRRFLEGQLEGWEVINLEAQAGLSDLEKQRSTVFNFTLAHDTPEIREFLFTLVRSIAGDSPFYFSGTECAKNDDFMNIVKFNSYINLSDLSTSTHPQEQVINSLGKLLIPSLSSLRGFEQYHLRDVALAFLDIPSTAKIEKNENQRVRDYKSKIDSVMEESKTLHQTVAS